MGKTRVNCVALLRVELDGQLLLIQASSPRGMVLTAPSGIIETTEIGLLSLIEDFGVDPVSIQDSFRLDFVANQEPDPMALQGWLQTPGHREVAAAERIFAGFTSHDLQPILLPEEIQDCSFTMTSIGATRINDPQTPAVCVYELYETTVGRRAAAALRLAATRPEVPLQLIGPGELAVHVSDNGLSIAANTVSLLRNMPELHV